MEISPASSAPSSILILAVADLARALAGGVDDELLAHRQLALEAAADLGVVDGDRALEHAVLGDLEHARVERRLDAAFDDQRVAVADLDALDLDLPADHELRLAARVAFSAAGCTAGARDRSGREVAVTGVAGRKKLSSRLRGKNPSFCSTLNALSVVMDGTAECQFARTMPTHFRSETRA